MPKADQDDVRALSAPGDSAVGRDSDIMFEFPVVVLPADDESRCPRIHHSTRWDAEALRRNPDNSSLVHSR